MILYIREIEVVDRWSYWVLNNNAGKVVTTHLYLGG